MLSLKYKDSTAEEKKEMLLEITSRYDFGDKSQVIQAMAHCQAVYNNTQDEFAEIAGVTSRTLREWKKEYIEIYDEAFKKYTPEPTVIDVEAVHDEDVLEQVYQNMLAKISDKKTSAKDLATLLTYLNISSTELKQYAKHRGATMRAYVKDNEALLIRDEDTLNLTKSFLSESDYLYFGTEKTVGNTENFLQLDFEDNLTKLELMTAGLLMYSLWNGAIHPIYVEMAETLRVLKSVANKGKDTLQAIKDFDSMDNKPVKLKPFKISERDCLDIFGADAGSDIYEKLSNVKSVVAKTTAVKLPAYEVVKEDYYKHLKLFSDKEVKPLDVLLAELDTVSEDNYKDKYTSYVNQEEK